MMAMCLACGEMVKTRLAGHGSVELQLLMFEHILKQHPAIAKSLSDMAEMLVAAKVFQAFALSGTRDDPRGGWLLMEADLERAIELYRGGFYSVLDGRFNPPPPSEPKPGGSESAELGGVVS